VNGFSLVKARAAVVIIENDKIALIERYRSGQHYFVFPGGKVKSGESPIGAAAREAEEELGLKVMIGALVAEIGYLGASQYYFLADPISGQFGNGDGSEMKSLPDSEKGSYHPLWMAMDEIQNIPLLPKIMAEYIVQSYKEGWRENPLKAFDDSPDDLVSD
jgi:8-oxo-dGTP pyrophosphatase MutT (NUDIX family)